MDEREALRTFSRLRIITVQQLVNLLHCSVITVRRRLRKWRAYTSINHNGRYYALPPVPIFDANGLWRHQSVLFSRHGNLKQTILSLIRQSPMGLSAGEIAQLLDLSATSSYFTHIHQATGISREKHDGRFVYFSDSSQQYDRQKQERILSGPGAVDWPTDAQAVVVLVEFIKHPRIGVKELSLRLTHQGCSVEPIVIEAFLKRHDLLKKTLDTEQ
jgi:hypothetical protein